MAHGHGPDDDRTFDPNCSLCRIVQRLNETFAALEPPSPRYRYWEGKRPRFHYTYEYTTTTANEGKFWAIQRRWVKGQGRIAHKVGFRQRNKAKARAYQWYLKATAKPSE